MRLRLRLSESRPDLVGRAQSSLVTLVRGLVEAAATAGRIEVDDVDGATFMLLSVNASYITAETMGTDADGRRPDVVTVLSFCLHGLGAKLDDGWYERIEPALRLPGAGRHRAPPRSRP